MYSKWIYSKLVIAHKLNRVTLRSEWILNINIYSSTEECGIPFNHNQLFLSVGKNRDA